MENVRFRQHRISFQENGQSIIHTLMSVTLRFKQLERAVSGINKRKWVKK